MRTDGVISVTKTGIKDGKTKIAHGMAKRTDEAARLRAVSPNFTAKPSYFSSFSPQISEKVVSLHLRTHAEPPRKRLERLQGGSTTF